jgi:UMF1 family MFS transporter
VTRAPRLLRRLALGRPELRAFALYDWANSVFLTTVIQLFPIYFARVAAADVPLAEASRRFSLATSAGMMATALLAPLLGAVADHGRLKKTLLAVFLGLGVAATGGLALTGRGDWAAGVALFVIANVGLNGSQVFYDSLLPHVARRREVDRLATTSFAAGYAGGGLLFALNVLWIRWPHAFGLADEAAAMRLSFLSAAVWWLAFSLPLLWRVPEPPGPERAPAGPSLLSAGFRRLGRTLRELRTFRNAFLFLGAFVLYSDASNTIVRLGTIYGTELGLPASALILAVLMAQAVGVPCALLFGALAARIGAKRALYVSLLGYAAVTAVGYGLRTAGDFFVLAFLVGTVQGGSMALSRSLFASLVPRHKAAEFFGFFGVFEKLGSVAGPALFAASIGLTGSSRQAVPALVLLFAGGALLLRLVDVDAGRRAARAAERAHAAA